MLKKKLIKIIKTRVKIEDVASCSLDLKPAGFYFKSRCFRCGDKDHFTVHPEKQRYYCFNCQDCGDVIALVSAIHECSREEAITKLIEAIIKNLEDRESGKNWVVELGRLNE